MKERVVCVEWELCYSRLERNVAKRNDRQVEVGKEVDVLVEYSIGVYYQFLGSVKDLRKIKLEVCWRNIVYKCVWLYFVDLYEVIKNIEIGFNIKNGEIFYRNFDFCFFLKNQEMCGKFRFIIL